MFVKNLKFAQTQTTLVDSPLDSPLYELVNKTGMNLFSSPSTSNIARCWGCECELSSGKAQNWHLPFCAFLSRILTGQVVESTQHLGCHQRHLFLPIPSLNVYTMLFVEAVEVANVSNSKVTATSDSVKSNSRCLCRPLLSLSCFPFT